MKNSIFIKVLLLALLTISFANSTELKQKEYYKIYKAEWDKLPLANKKRIAEAYKLGEKENLGYTLAATRFLENRGKASTFDKKDSINKNIHRGYVTYDCGAFGINTMTYLRTVNKVTKDQNAHINACKKLANDKSLNLKVAVNVYDYALDRFDGNWSKAWNYYNTGREEIINDRVVKMKSVLALLKKELRISRLV